MRPSHGKFRVVRRGVPNGTGLPPRYPQYERGQDQDPPPHHGNYLGI
ncbi:hypothetical protein TSC_c16500 [Thermus scotoductus SA-01]|uniref:Uncharacterized protein n=1 Tax=Thermus scotoductus (strain ATCC 700910 / SA-01) TaxID=743525 RepID=E8PL41_THESS|nr:hypothetical protein TSC_c16500 [Thermus scotoductus SA-01]